MPKWLPNALTGARLVAIVPFAILLSRADEAVSPAAAVIFAAASATDFLDGYLARHAHVQSRFGRIADPAADRLLVDIALIILVVHARLAWWLAVPVVARDALLAVVFGTRREMTAVQVNRVGKCATALIMLGLLLLMSTSATWPLWVYAGGVVLSLAAGGLYLLRPEEEGMTSRPS
ncbi:MAG TPA: CDP-alcohol phosphatidyltransferase family protein [Thermoleophilia bacterium]|nr:CDP-alcohol phosphatidyltransferase family protein [Thermoleophilia bacterium]